MSKAQQKPQPQHSLMLNDTKADEKEEVDSSPVEPPCLSCKTKLIISIIIGVFLLGTAGFFVLYFAFGKGKDGPPHGYNPFVVKNITREERNLTAILWNNKYPNSKMLRNEEMKNHVNAENPESQFLRVEVKSLNDHHLNLKILDANRTRWEVRDVLDPNSTKDLPGEMDVSSFINIFQHYSLDDLRFNVTSEPFGWELWGAETQRMNFPIISSKFKPLQFKDKYIEFELELPCEYLFGLPQLSSGMKLEQGNYTVWNRYNIAPDGSEEGLGTISFLLCKLRSNKYLGLFLDNSNAHMISTWSGPNTTYINYKLTGGIIDLNIFHVGDPWAILKLYHQFVGKPACPPLWSMGLQQSRDNYNSIDAIKTAVQKYYDSGMPLDAIWMNQLLMDDYKVFTVSKERYPGIQEYIAQLKEQGIHFVQTVYPHVKEANYPIYNDAIKKRAFIRDPHNTTDPNNVQKTKGFNTMNCTMLDILNAEGKRIMGSGLKMLYNVSFYEGLLLRQESPYTMCSGFCNENKLNSVHDPYEYEGLPFEPAVLKNMTLPLSSYHNVSEVPEYVSDLATHYNVHNILPLLYLKAIDEMSREDEYNFKTLQVASVASPRMGQYSSLWLGDSKSEWSSLSNLIKDTIAYNLAGIPSVGAPVCGYNGVTRANISLCIRWYQLAAYLPMMRIHHAGVNDIEPYAFLNELAIKQALDARYSLLKFIYTKFTETELYGGPVWEPVAFSFPSDENCFKEEVIAKTFVIGKILYVVPSLEKSQTPGEGKVKAYLPNSHWYKLTDLTLAQKFDPASKDGKYYDLLASYNYTNVFIKGGSIFPYQSGTFRSTKELDEAYATIIVAPDEKGQARGTLLTANDIENELAKKLYNHYSFTYSNNIFRVNMIEGYNNPFNLMPDYFNEILILNMENPEIDYACLLEFSLKKTPLQVTYDSKNKVLKLNVTSGYSHVLLKDVESVVFGGKSSQNLCQCTTQIKDITYSSDRKSVVAKLESTDKRNVKEEYKLGFKLLNDYIVYMQTEKNDGEKHWRVPDVIEPNVINNPSSKISLDQFSLKLPNSNSPFSFTFTDEKDANNKVLSSDGLPFIYKSKYIEFGIRIYGSRLFGLGERITQFEIKDGVYTLFSKGVPSPEETGKRPGKNMYGSHPFYMFQLTKQTDFGGVFILNSNAIDIKVYHEPSQHMIITHVLTGGVLEMFFIKKAKPEYVIKDFHMLIGKPTLVPYWAFGYHQSRWGYDSQSVLEEVVANFTEKGIPLDVLWSDIDYMVKYQDFTLDTKRFPTMREFIQKLHQKGISYVPILDAGIARQKGYSAYEKGKQLDLFIKSTRTKNDLTGIVWPGYAVFTDFMHPQAESYWVENLAALRDILPFDGIWLDMNEATNFCDGECPDEINYVDEQYEANEYDSLLYYPGHSKLNQMTISIDGTHSNKEAEYNLHNMYGFYMAKATHKFFNETLKVRPFIISRSTFPGFGRFASHWLGDNYSKWDYMKYSLAGIYNFHMFGIPLVGADVCGFIGPVDLELCKRWMQLGAFYPFYRNHKETFWGHQEPYVEEELTKISIHAIQTRYSLFRYLYSNYFRVAIEGGTFFRPLFWEFSNEPQSYAHNHLTFMLGSSLKISPSFAGKGATNFTSYFPNADWYHAFTGEKILSYEKTSLNGQTISLNCSYSPPELNVHLRGGYGVILAAETAMSLQDTLHKHVNLIMAPFEDKAQAFIYYDNEAHNTIESENYQYVSIALAKQMIHFVSSKRKFTYQYQDDIIDVVKIYNAAQYKDTKCAKLGLTNGIVKVIQSNYDNRKEILHLHSKTSVNDMVNITWSNEKCTTHLISE